MHELNQYQPLCKETNDGLEEFTGKSVGILIISFQRLQVSLHDFHKINAFLFAYFNSLTSF